MPLVQLVHWNAAEGARRARTLRSAGYEVRFESLDPFPAALERVKAEPPDVFVIDLSRLPSAGRDVALVLREARATRFVPIVFVDGEDGKVAKTRKLLPDATYTSWNRIRGAVGGALRGPIADPVVPSTRLAGYSGTPLMKKLGIKEGMRIALVGAPLDVDRILGDLPSGTVVLPGGRAKADLVLLFVRSRTEYLRRLEPAAARSGGEIWVCWPKKASGFGGEIDQQAVREAGLSRGLVDYKIAAIDEIWSALRFTRRKA